MSLISIKFQFGNVFHALNQDLFSHIWIIILIK